MDRDSGVADVLVGSEGDEDVSLCRGQGGRLEDDLHVERVRLGGQEGIHVLCATVCEASECNSVSSVRIQRCAKGRNAKTTTPGSLICSCLLLSTRPT